MLGAVAAVGRGARPPVRPSRTTWPYTHLGTLQHGLLSNKMALITSECAPFPTLWATFDQHGCSHLGLCALPYNMDYPRATWP